MYPNNTPISHWASQTVDLKAKLWDGTLVPMKQSSVSLILEMQNAKLKIRPYIVDLMSYDIILGKSWLAQHNPKINWHRNRMLLNINGKLFTLDAEKSEHWRKTPSKLLTGKQLLTLWEIGIYFWQNPDIIA